jgi:hypothetical protein
MQITPIDNCNNLFSVENVFSDDLVQKILTTDWLNLPTVVNRGQEHWIRRSIDINALDWINQWRSEIHLLWNDIVTASGRLVFYSDPVFWVDLPGFNCPIHTDGDLPGAMQLYWIGELSQGTVFYKTNASHDIKHRFLCEPNTGYIMSNKAGVATDLWHGMLDAVKPGTYRLSSYIHLLHSEYVSAHID